MSRALRLLDLGDRLRAAAETTAGALARDLGVSERTVRRDLAALRAAGCRSPASRARAAACGSRAPAD
jgi:predicted DNA-binding transcriptional regulator YafY